MILTFIPVVCSITGAQLDITVCNEPPIPSVLIFRLLGHSKGGGGGGGTGLGVGFGAGAGVGAGGGAGAGAGAGVGFAQALRPSTDTTSTIAKKLITTLCFI